MVGCQDEGRRAAVRLYNTMGARLRRTNADIPR